MHDFPMPPSSPPSAAASGALEDVLDPGMLAQLRQLDPQGRSKLIERVLGAYVQSLQKLLTQLPLAPQPDDAPNIRQLAHTLKSSSASVGALRMSQHCASVERAIREGHLEQWQQEVPVLRTEAQHLLQGLAHAGVVALPGAAA
jgi:HPt (histidine-containing phosphotransfer) domain-containing protein